MRNSIHKKINNNARNRNLPVLMILHSNETGTSFYYLKLSIEFITYVYLICNNIFFFFKYYLNHRIKVKILVFFFNIMRAFFKYRLSVEYLQEEQFNIIHIVLK